MNDGKRTNTEKTEIDKEISVNSVSGQPETAFDMINKYGTYEIQPTCDSENKYPEISQGLSHGISKEQKKGKNGKKV